ncbi:MAG: hypothetical protein AAF642_01380 [Pseudomonadota bacterium]
MKYLLSVAILALTPVLTAHAATTESGMGRIIALVGHEVEACAVVTFRSNATNTTQSFRIPNGGEQIFAAVMRALVSTRDVQVFYDPQLTTGCGPEPKIIFIKLF